MTVNTLKHWQQGAMIGVMVTLLNAGPALAAASLSPSEISEAETDLKSAISLIEGEQYEPAIAKLMKIYNGIGADSDALNYLGFAHRKLGKNDEALRFYEEALELDPAHLAANEYLGELFIQTGELDKAATQLEILTKLCGSCAESEMLAEAIAQAQAGEMQSSLRW